MAHCMVFVPNMDYYPSPSATASKRSHPLWRMIKIAGGLGFLGLGFVGLFLPVLQGVLFLLVGLTILSTESRRVRRLRDEIKRRHPGPWVRAQALKQRLRGWVGISTHQDREAARDEGRGGTAS